jgi:uncharacterized protein (DUF1697 family)
MPKYIAFLRAINVGGHVVKMDRLRSLFEELSFENVETFIASGNVIFDSRTRNARALEGKIEKYLAASLGYSVATFIRTPAELKKIAGQKRLKPDQSLYVGFLREPPAKEAARKVISLSTRTDEFDVAESELYWVSRKSFGTSNFSGAILEKAIGPATFRNITTVIKLADKYS